MTLTAHHTADHNTLRDAILTQAARLGVTVDIGGPYHLGDPAHIQEHNRTTEAVQALADVVAYEGELPPDRKLGDTGHIHDHQLWDTALTEIGKMAPIAITMAHTGNGVWTITDYTPKLRYALEVVAGQATLSGGTITFSTADGTVNVLVNGKVRKVVTRKQYTYHDHWVPYQSCYNPCGNCRTDVNPHTWGCGCGSPCGDSGGGQWGDCVCHGPGYNERVRDDTPAGFTDEYSEWSCIADPAAIRYIASWPVGPSATLKDGWLNVWLPFGQHDMPGLKTDCLSFGDAAVFSFDTDIDLVRWQKDPVGQWWCHYRMPAPWCQVGMDWHWKAYDPARSWDQSGKVQA